MPHPPHIKYATELEMPRPSVSLTELAADLDHYYSLDTADVKELLSYDDTMYQFTAQDARRYIAKYYNTELVNEDEIGSITDMLVHLGEKYSVPVPVKQKQQQATVTLIGKNASNSGCKTCSYLVVFHYIEGEQLQFKKREPAFWRTLGQLVGEMSVSMSEVKCSDFARKHPWDPLGADSVLRGIKGAFPAERVPCVNIDKVIESIKTMREALASYPQQLINSDVNEYNIIVRERGDTQIGIIDFNDMIKSYRVFELGHLLGYMLEAQQSDLQVAQHLYSGYASVTTLSPPELRMLYDIIINRFTLSITLGNRAVISGEANAYVAKCVEDNVHFLKTFSDLGRKRFTTAVLGV